MYVVENPVLQRELLANLRSPRSFLLLFLYQFILGLIVLLAWPNDTRLDLTEPSADAGKLVQVFFLGQYVLACLMTPSFAAGSITGEKERKTYEMLLASPVRPSAIVFGKLVASLSHLAVLVFTSLPIVMLCLPLGGVSPHEVLAAYMALILSVVTFGAISVACSSIFRHTSAALVVSYLLILPLALLAVLAWSVLAESGTVRFWLTVTGLPVVSIVLCAIVIARTSARLLHPPDVGSEGKEVVDVEQEARRAVGLVIQREQFPDRLFAPPKRADLLPDGANPVYDKEIRSEIFSQGTLMLRLVIQVSMVLAIPLMAVCLYIQPEYAAWYISYVVLFSMLVGPVFSAGSVTSERERQTLDLLLTTTITPGQILWGKLLAGLRVSSVLTCFLLWPLLLACALVQPYWTQLFSVAAFLSIVLISCLTTATVALFCSVVFHKTSLSLIGSYLAIVSLYCIPLVANFFAIEFFQEQIFTDRVAWLGVTSPFAAAFSVPFNPEVYAAGGEEVAGNWPLVGAHLVTMGILNAALLGSVIWLFRARWRVAT